MIAIEVSFLTGRYVASAHDRRDHPEWPPHWARFYGAMVAAWGDETDTDEADLLRKIEAWGHPEIAASDASVRRASAHWVPVNDTSVHGLKLQERRTKQLDEALSQHAEAAVDGSEKKMAAAARRIDKARDVDEQVGRVGTTPERTALQLLPEHRVRQERRYPSVTPEDPSVYFVWAGLDLKEGDLDRLDRLLSRVTRLGHSSSFVSCRVRTGVAADLESPRFVPGQGHGRDRIMLRSIGAGQFDALVAGHARHGGSGPRAMPFRGARYRDRHVDPDDGPTPFRSTLSGEMIVLERTAGARLPITRAVELGRAVRGALMSHAAEPIPEIICGHRSSPQERGGTAPSVRPHAAYVALPFVGHRRATGHILGIAVVLPRDASAAEAEQVEAAVVAARRGSAPDGASPTRLGPTQPIRITLGRVGAIDLTAVLDDGPVAGLRPATWIGPSQTWVSATPIALPRHPGSLRGGSSARERRAWSRATEGILRACEHVGLPQPTDVRLQLAPMLAGSRHVRSFPEFAQGAGQRRQVRALVHAEIRFSDLVAGPVLLGAGRFQGLGLMRPVVAG